MKKIMTNKKMLLTSIIALSVALVVVLVSFSVAWYQQQQNESLGMSLSANGVLVIYFDEGVITGDTNLRPATAMPNAVRDNLPMDVLTVYDPSSPTPSYVSRAATVAQYDSVLKYYNEGSSSEYASDITIDCTAKIVMPDTTAYYISTINEINIRVTVAVEYLDESMPPRSFSVNLGTPFTVEKNAIITIGLETYLMQVDELSNPALISALGNGALVISVGVVAVSQEGEGNS